MLVTATIVRYIAGGCTASLGLVFYTLLLIDKKRPIKNLLEYQVVILSSICLVALTAVIILKKYFGLGG